VRADVNVIDKHLVEQAIGPGNLWCFQHQNKSVWLEEANAYGWLQGDCCSFQALREILHVHGDLNTQNMACKKEKTIIKRYILMLGLIKGAM